MFYKNFHYLSLKPIKHNDAKKKFYLYRKANLNVHQSNYTNQTINFFFI